LIRASADTRSSRKINAVQVAAILRVELKDDEGAQLGFRGSDLNTDGTGVAAGLILRPRRPLAGA